MKNKILISVFVFSSTLFLLWRCGSISNSSVTRQNFATQYYADEKVMRPKYVIYNVTDSLTRMYFSVKSTDLLYTKNNYDAFYSARIILTYVVHPYDFAKVITDSGRVVLSDVGQNGVSKLLASSVEMDIYATGKYYVEVILRDLNKMASSYELLYLDHRGKDSKNNFLFTQDSTETPLFKSYVGSDETFSIHYTNPNTKKLFVRYYKNKYGPAPPPYSTAEHRSGAIPDSTWWINIIPKQTFTFPQEGFYTFNSDSLANGGGMLARFHEQFPKIIIARQLVYPLRYLTMRDEYLAMDTSKNIKKAVDQFWLSCTGSEERAREVIRNFYNRVEASNKLFATQMEGWKTDRGMIYLIFGPPENVYRHVNSETWIYGSSAGSTGLTFVFDHKENAFTDQEFVLERNSEFKVNWITAVDSWRQGHVYTLR